MQAVSSTRWFMSHHLNCAARNKELAMDIMKLRIHLRSKCGHPCCLLLLLCHCCCCCCGLHAWLNACADGMPWPWIPAVLPVAYLPASLTLFVPVAGLASGEQAELCACLLTCPRLRSPPAPCCQVCQPDCAVAQRAGHQGGRGDAHHPGAGAPLISTVAAAEVWVAILRTPWRCFVAVSTCFIPLY